MAGRFAQAEGGTLFLDEIGDMPMETQTRLLRVCRKVSLRRSGATADQDGCAHYCRDASGLAQLIQQGFSAKTFISV